MLGLKGVDLMAEEAEKTPLKAMLTTPSCVPAVPGFEDSGAEITAADIASEMKHDYTVGLGEMMNFPGITASAEPTPGSMADVSPHGTRFTRPLRASRAEPTD